MKREIELKIELSEEDYLKLQQASEIDDTITVFTQIWTPSELPNYILRAQILELTNGTTYRYGCKEKATQEGLNYMDRKEFEVDIPETFFKLLQKTQTFPDIQYKETCQYVKLPENKWRVRLDKISGPHIPDMFEMEIEFDNKDQIKLGEPIIKSTLMDLKIPYKRIQISKHQRVWEAME